MLKEWIWWKTYSQGITKDLSVDERSILYFEVWEPEMEKLTEQLIS